MFKRILKKIYDFFPFQFKFFFKDLYFYCRARTKGAVTIRSIDFDPDFERVAVLGNGPSLKEDKKQFLQMKNDHDFICVNNFCDDPLYKELKPKLYIFLDAYFFADNAHPDWVKRREKTFSIIQQQTDWPMQVILPHGANEKVLKRFINKKHIKIIKISTQSLFCNSYNRLVGKMYDSGFYGPPQINVLIYAIHMAVRARYKRIYIYGADLSFHNDVNVDQNTNELFITFRHFNQENSVEVLRKNPEKVKKWRMAELLQTSADTFLAHEILAEYSKAKGVAIFNKSSQSLIDAYPRHE